MACFVHNRRFLSKFHGAINQLRQSNEFTEVTLRQLPKRCCSCPEKQNNTTFSTIEPLLTSLNIDALRLVCLQMEFKKYLTTNELPSQSMISNYTVLHFPIVLDSKEHINLLNQFIDLQDQQLRILKHIHHVDFQFVTSTTCEQLLYEIIQIKYNLLVKCSNYQEAIQAIDGILVIISAKDQLHADIAKHALQQQWFRFMKKIVWYSSCTTYNWRQNFPSKIKIKKSSNKQQFKIKNKKIFKKRGTTWQRMQEINELSEEEEEYMTEQYSDEDEEISPSINSCLNFLNSRFENSNKLRRPRTHRRQHMLALAIAA
ncbi:unnamed protein product [Adineta steineri]|uniref:Uncharacterized protein n=1 Tax=Adineta steineri TaxID=433720 RepID=A0A813SES2_9BILA|nr:unnamed protein product [Adineta steineri]CAF0795675.1 unnamed protein product [Adineta steineri]